MVKMARITGIYNLISGLSMVTVWVILWLGGLFPRDNALLLPEALTVVVLCGSGISLLLKQGWGEKLAFLALGMLLYAVVLGCGKFALSGHWAWALFFGVISLSCIVIISCNFLLHKVR